MFFHSRCLLACLSGLFEVLPYMFSWLPLNFFLADGLNQLISWVRIHSNKPYCWNHPPENDHGNLENEIPKSSPRYLSRCESIGKGNASVWDPETPENNGGRRFFFGGFLAQKMGPWVGWVIYRDDILPSYI